MSLMLHRMGVLKPTLPPAANAVPDAFEAEDWSIAPGDAKADVTIYALPDDGGATITDIEYRLDGGSWISSGGTSSFTIDSLTNDQEYDAEIRALNSVGAGAASDAKSVALEDENENWHPNDLANPPLAVWDPTISSSLWQDTSATTAAGDGDPLGRIDDQSGNSNHAVQPTSTKRPQFDIIDGKPWIVCDGTDDGMSFTSVKPAMVAIVYYAVSPGPFDGIFVRAENSSPGNSIRLSADGLQWRSPPSSANVDDFSFNDGETRINGAAALALTPNTAQILTVKAGTGGNQAIEGLAAFGLSETSGRAWPGHLGRMVLLSAVPNAEEYTNLLAWLAEPYGIAL